MSEASKTKRFASNSDTGCIDQVRMRMLKQLANVNLFASREVESTGDHIAAEGQMGGRSYYEQSNDRSNSLFDLLNRQLSQTSTHTYNLNMPRQTKSIFSPLESHFPQQKELAATIETDINHLQPYTPTSTKTLKESIYQKLLRGKCQNKSSKTKSKIFNEVAKEATFRPQKGALKSMAKDAFRVKDFKNSKIRSTLNTEETPRHATKYQALLKYSNLVQNENADSTNRPVQALPLPVGRAIPCDKAQQLNLQKSLELKRSNYSSQFILWPTKQSILDLNFQQRQQKCIRSRSVKVIQNQINKLRDELSQCTFRPRLTPYRRSLSRNQAELQSYGELRKSLSKPIFNYR